MSQSESGGASPRRDMDPMLSMLSSAVMAAKQACDAAAMALRLYHESRAGGASQQDASQLELPKTFMSKLDRAASAGTVAGSQTEVPPTIQPTPEH